MSSFDQLSEVASDDHVGVDQHHHLGGVSERGDGLEHEWLHSLGCLDDRHLGGEQLALVVAEPGVEQVDRLSVAVEAQRVDHRHRAEEVFGARDTVEGRP